MSPLALPRPHHSARARPMVRWPRSRSSPFCRSSHRLSGDAGRQHRHRRLVASTWPATTGVGGMTSFGQVAFVGTGAYSAAVMATFQPADLPFGLSFFAGSPIAGLVLGSSSR